jgi:predicted alpha-1,2-mannosidase
VASVLWSKMGHGRRRGRVSWCLGAATLGALVGVGGGGGPAGASTAPVVTDPAALVNPFAGTGTGPVSPGTVSEFPGAVVPFGMMAWSPDTSPDRSPGGGYAWKDHRISGFSLTHLSGTGCASYGDIPILPTTGALGADPATATQPFSHGGEQASPGRYAVRLGDPAIATALTVTTRSGIGTFTFPRTTDANFLFKVADSAAGVSTSSVQISGTDEVSGSVTSGQFCQTGTDYTLHFAALFDRPFTSAGTWSAGTTSPGSRQCTGTACGAFVTFDAARDPVVEMKVGISFVSGANAAANLAAEDPGWSAAAVAARATALWNRDLSRIAVGGGTAAGERTFYTALYHSLLEPNVVSDVNGQYPGADGSVATATLGTEYANFSEWDIYRCEIPLLAMLFPGQTSAMVQSLVDSAAQTGWLPKWEIVAGDASQMNGDSADPIIAAAYAFGARGFDTGAALAAMVKGATESQPNRGLEIERQYLDQYLAQHYITAGSRDLTSIDYTIGGSATLEYAIDDFSIAQLAEALGDAPVAATMEGRAGNWQYLFNPATGYLQARNADGSFPPGPAFTRGELEPGGQNGFEEGNAIQYTWSVPQDLAGLATLMGGDRRAVATLDAFFTKLNVGRFAPYDWAGNEPGIGIPFAYDAVGAPWRTQSVVRRIATTLYGDGPVDEPGNDDLGAISSWLVWADIGLYPETPGTADLALASPLFPTVVVHLGSGHQLVLHAPAAAPGSPYVQSVDARGIAPPSAGTGGAAACGTGSPGPGAGGGRWIWPWLPASVVAGGGSLTLALGDTPDTHWGAAPDDAFPSSGAGQLPAVGYTLPSGGLSVLAGGTATFRLGLDRQAPPGPAVTWTVQAPSGVTVSPDHGTFAAVTGRCGPGTRASTPVSVDATTPGTVPVSVTLTTATGTVLPPVVLDVTVRQ